MNWAAASRRPPAIPGEQGAWAGEATMANIADAFRREFAAAASAGLREGWIGREATEDLEPSSLIGVPALALFAVLRRSAERAPGARALACDDEAASPGAMLGEAAMSRNCVAAAFWPRLMRGKAAVERAGQLSPAALEYVNVWLLGGGGGGWPGSAAVGDQLPGHRRVAATPRYGCVRRRLPRGFG